MFKTKLSLTFCLFFALPITRTTAQIIPDSTLGTENSVVTLTDELNDKIEGGATRGSNLFHSFREFNVGEGRGVDFVNPAGVENILTRVTGSNVSNIFSRLGVLGSANLFLINPNGIVFGAGARLDMGGSFYGSTAESILFPNNVEFSATNPQSPLLMINVPIGLGLGNNPGTIINQSVANNSNGLELLPGKNITLVGGNLNFESGRITAPGGRVELGGLSSEGIVSIKEDGNLSFPEDVTRADITLTNDADVDVSAGGGGSITVNARNLELSAGELGSSSLRAGIVNNSGLNNARAGEITINATDNISVSQESSIVNQVGKRGVGNAGGIKITTTNLTLTEGSQIDARTFGRGNAGKISITASGTILANRESLDGEESSGIFNRVERSGIGNAGGINIDTANLFLTQGGQIDASTYGQGNGGTITIKATDNILVQGRRPSNSNQISRIVTTIGNGGIGEGGDITIDTSNLSLSEGGRINASTFGTGNSGSIIIKATDTISVRGDNNNRPSGIFSQVGNDGVGNADGITITTNNLSLQNQGELSVSGRSNFDSGNIVLNAELITLDDQSTIMAETESGSFGNITLNNLNLLTLRRGSSISTNATGSATGGNININAADGFIVALPNENSDITSNAYLGSGGTININAVGIFGISELSREKLIKIQGTDDPDELDPTEVNSSDITAVSQTSSNLNGQININSLEIEPTRQLFLLPTQPLNSQIAQNCTSGTKEASSELIFTGKGGIAPNNLENMQLNPTTPDWLELPSRPKHTFKSSNLSTNQPTNQIIEAQGWIRNENGEVILVADAASVTPHDSWQKPKQCDRS